MPGRRATRSLAMFAGGSTAPHFWPGLAGTRRRPQAPGDRFAVEAGIGEPDEDVPPVVNERKQPGREPATGEIVRRVAAPTPLVLHLVENILAVAPVAIELTERFHIFIE